MQWKQLALARGEGKRCYLLEPIGPAEGEELTEKQEARRGHSGTLIGK